MTTKTPLECKTALQLAKQRFGAGEISESELNTIADEYIAAIRAYKERTGNKKLRIPTRAYLIRAI